jgi:oxygen-dependent protoporphyrinogen oxidase
MVERLVESLQSRRVSLRLNARVASVRDLGAGSWEIRLENGGRLFADGLILATPAFDAARLLASLDPALAAELERIPYASTATVSLAYRKGDVPRPLDGYGYVIPRREGRRALACTWTSTKFPHRAPEGWALIRVFVGRAAEEIERTESELLDLAREELRLSLGVTTEPLLHRVHVWPRAMPQYNLGHPEILSRIDGALRRHAGLALIGSGYRGIGIPDCIHSGEQAAQRILEEMPASAASRASYATLNAPASTI